MKTYITYGAIGTIVSALLNLALFFTGYQTEKLAVGQYIAMFGYVVFIVILVLGMIDVRESKPDKALSYGNAVLAALMISIFYGLFSAVYAYLHFTFVNPNFPQYMMDVLRTQFEAKGVPEAQIDAILTMQGKMLAPPVQALLITIMTPILGTIFGLIIAIFVKRAPAVEQIKAS